MAISIRLRDVLPLLAALVLVVLCFALPPIYADEAEPATAEAETTRVLIIDAGHGGEDGGAVTAGGVPESASTTAQRKQADQKARIELINSQSDAVLISIHQNFFPTAQPSGCQVLYGKPEGSRELGELTHKNLTEALCPTSRRVAAPISEDIYLMRSAKCTSILVECGFLSNPSEAALLQTEDYQLKISALLLASYLQYEAGSDGMVL